MGINKLKKLFAAIMLIVACASCTKETINEINLKYNIILDEMKFSADGGEKTKTIELCSDDWSYNDLDEEWISVDRDGDNLVVTVDPNETNQIRSVYCIVSAQHEDGDNNTTDLLYLNIIQDGE